MSTPALLTPLAPGVVPIIVHVEHTGGTTLLDIIERQYRDDELYRIYKYVNQPTTRFMNMPEAERRRYKALVGHLYYGLHRHVPAPSRYVTLLREPIDRIIATYNYGARKANVRHHEEFAAGTMTWRRHLAERPAGLRQVTRIAGGDDELIQVRRNPDVPPDITETAIRNIEADFALVGLQERYDETLLMLRYVLNWTQPVYYVRQNITVKRLRLADLSAEDRALVEKTAEVEIPLYEYAKKRFESYVASYPGDLEREVAQFRADNERYAVGQARLDRLKNPMRALRRALRRFTRPSRKR